MVCRSQEPSASSGVVHGGLRGEQLVAYSNHCHGIYHCVGQMLWQAAYRT